MKQEHINRKRERETLHYLLFKKEVFVKAFVI